MVSKLPWWQEQQQQPPQPPQPQQPQSESVAMSLMYAAQTQRKVVAAHAVHHPPPPPQQPGAGWGEESEGSVKAAASQIAQVNYGFRGNGESALFSPAPAQVTSRGSLTGAFPDNP